MPRPYQNSCCSKSEFSHSMYGVDNTSIRNITMDGDRCGGRYIAKWNIYKKIDCDACDGITAKLGAMLTVVGHKVIARHFSKSFGGVSSNVPAISNQIRIQPGTMTINAMTDDSKQIEEIFDGQWGVFWLPIDERICTGGTSTLNCYWWIKCTDALFINVGPQMWNTCDVGEDAAAGKTPFQSYKLEIVPREKKAKLSSRYDVGGGLATFSSEIDFSVLSKGILAPCADEDGGPPSSHFSAKGDLTQLALNANGEPYHDSFEVLHYHTVSCPPSWYDYFDCFKTY